MYDVDVEVIGGSKSQKEIARKVITWYIKSVMPKIRKLDITVRMTNCHKNGVLGYCTETEDNRTFEIEIDRSLRMYDFVSTLCHEMTHLKQYARGEMKQLKNGSIRWKKVVYSRCKPYNDLPWEKEATRVDEKLAIKCFKEVL